MGRPPAGKTAGRRWRRLAVVGAGCAVLAAVAASFMLGGGVPTGAAPGLRAIIVIPPRPVAGAEHADDLAGPAPTDGHAEAEDGPHGAEAAGLGGEPSGHADLPPDADPSGPGEHAAVAPPADPSHADGAGAAQAGAGPTPAGRIALIVGDLGPSRTRTQAALDRLPPAVSLAFSPYASGLDTWIGEARSQGHEVLMMVPLEPTTYPTDDPGPLTLLTLLDEAANRERLDQALALGTGAVGVLGTEGSRFTTVPEALRPVLQEIDARGLLFVDPGTTPATLTPAMAAEIGLPHAAARPIDAVPSPDAIEAALSALEGQALTEGSAVGVAFPYPVTLDAIADWLPTLDGKGLTLAPISAVAGEESGG